MSLHASLTSGGMASEFQRVANLKARPDEVILEDVWANILKDASIRALDRDSIRLEVKGGEVTVRGHVVKSAHRARIEELAAQVRGVTRVHNHLVVDHDLAIEIAQALAKDPRTRPNILSVNCYHGWVTLVGEVPDVHTQQAAEEVAASHPQARGVIALPRVSGYEGALARRPVQPEIGAQVYTRTGWVGNVSEVVIDPGNRLVRFIAITPLHAADGGQAGVRYVLPAEVIDFVRPGSVWLKDEAAGKIGVSPFNPAEFPLAPQEWQPPFPYQPGTIRWPARQRGATQV